ncbi:unnamed protein product [Danaus chrysippus]|uniref:(African queen) hypothetical protein n=1 Tax=Danaus chrysippus TaxID=151541 RepID=A0A8J2W9B8_9NEOP|nr:unnamed protein product [Danaus chrysippus]
MDGVFTRGDLTHIHAAPSYIRVFYRTSSRGTRQLVVNGHPFICRSYCLNHIKKTWKCASSSDCTAKVHTLEDKIVILNNDHSHPLNNSYGQHKFTFS